MYSITIPQKNIWNLQKFYADSSISNISGMLVFDGKLDFGRLAEAINMFVRNQEGIRLRFTEKDGKVCQYAAAYEYADIPVLSFGSMEEARKFLEDEGRKPFEMEDFAMYRFCIFDIPGQCGVFPCFNHMVSDAWTLSLFCRKVMEYYGVLGRGAGGEAACGLQYGAEAVSGTGLLKEVRTGAGSGLMHRKIDEERQREEREEMENGLRKEVWKEQGRTDIVFNSDSSRWRYSDEDVWRKTEKNRDV